MLGAEELGATGNDNAGFVISRPNQGLSVRRGEKAKAEPAVPGWSMPVDDLIFPNVERGEPYVCNLARTDKCG